jgi:hypothetical protein
MIALTARLNERDETIIQLQEELDAYDRIHRETEQLIESKTDRVNQLEGFISENNMQVPQEQVQEGDYLRDCSVFFPRQERKYPPLDNEANEDLADQLLTADEKIQELMQVIRSSQEELEIMRTNPGKANFMREKINELVNREVQEKLNRIQNSDKNVELMKDKMLEMQQYIEAQ